MQRKQANNNKEKDIQAIDSKIKGVYKLTLRQILLFLGSIAPRPFIYFCLFMLFITNFYSIE